MMLTPRTLVLSLCALIFMPHTTAYSASDAVPPVFGKPYKCDPVQIEVTGAYSSLANKANAWQSAVSVGTSQYAYPYFLLRRSAKDGLIEIVFFNDDGKGYFVTAVPLESSDGLSAKIVRSGHGENGAWQREQVLRFVTRGNELVATVNGREDVRRMFVLKKTYKWTLDFRFAPASPSPAALEAGMNLAKKLIIE